MGMTLTEKILARHAGVDRVEPGQIVNVNVDLVLANEISAAVAIGVMRGIKGATIPPVWTIRRDLSSTIAFDERIQARFTYQLAPALPIKKRSRFPDRMGTPGQRQTDRTSISRGHRPDRVASPRRFYFVNECRSAWNR